jgi:two-component system OmpR family response regulator
MPSPPLATPPAAQRLRVAGLDIDLAGQKAYVDGQLLALTRQEWRVLAALAASAGQVVAKARIAEALGLPASSNNVEFHVSRLRRKLERGSIETIRGRGYRLVP